MWSKRDHAFLSLSYMTLVCLSLGMTNDHHQGTSSSTSTLKFVEILFRHGDRTPTQSFPTDPYKDVSKYWPEGLGQLTNAGKMHHYKLGLHFRQRYNGFLSESYKPGEILIHSSDIDRCIMSAQTHFAGFYQPKNMSRNWSPVLRWTPIPIRTIPKDEDKYLRMTKHCPKYHILYLNMLRTDYVRNIKEENKELFDYVKRMSGSIHHLSLRQIELIDEILESEKMRNYKLPEWGYEVLDKLHQIAALDYELGTHTLEMKRLRGGPLLKLFLDNMIEKVKDEGSEGKRMMEKAHFYFAHDSTIVRLMDTLGIFNGIMPPYATALIFELHQDLEEDEPYVKILYHNETTPGEPYQLEVPGCGRPCTLSNLIQVTSAVIPDNWERECQLGPLTLASEGNYAFSTRVFLVMLTLSAVVCFLTVSSVKGIRLSWEGISSTTKDKLLDRKGYEHV